MFPGEHVDELLLLAILRRPDEAALALDRMPREVDVKAEVDRLRAAADAQFGERRHGRLAERVIEGRDLAVARPAQVLAALMQLDNLRVRRRRHAKLLREEREHAGETAVGKGLARVALHELRLLLRDRARLE
eukprot:3426539-Prymnesium_polylepis.2